MSLNSADGWPSAKEWLEAAKQEVKSAIESLGQLSGRIDDARDELLAVPASRCRGRAFHEGEMIADLEDAEEAVARLISWLTDAPWHDLEACNVEQFEDYKTAAAREINRFHGGDR